jgi:phage FluMu protein Com
VPSDPTTAPAVPPRREIRCWNCARLLAVFRSFVGAFEAKCPRCKVAYLRVTAYDDGEVLHQRITTVPKHWIEGGAPNRCRSCQRVLCSSAIMFGAIETKCRKCAASMTFGVVPDFTPQPRPTLDDTALVALMDDRYREALKTRAKLKAEVAVGLRFDVFRRDGFRCRYCGRSVEEGAILHADHVIPESKGGPTTLANLVTACQECNIGKSNKTL